MNLDIINSVNRLDKTPTVSDLTQVGGSGRTRETSSRTSLLRFLEILKLSCRTFSKVICVGGTLDILCNTINVFMNLQTLLKYCF